MSIGSSKSGQFALRLAAWIAALSMAACGAPVERPAGDERDVVDTVPGEVLEVPERAAQSFARALQMMEDGNWVEAELELEQLILEHPEFPGPLVNLAIVYSGDGRDAEAEETLNRALSLDPTYAPASNELGLLLRRQGRFDEAEAAYRQAVDAEPDYALGHYNLAILLDLYLHRGAEALEQYLLYQGLLSEPDEQVARWIIDLERRVAADAERVARGE